MTGCRTTLGRGSCRVFQLTVKQHHYFLINTSIFASGNSRLCLLMTEDATFALRFYTFQGVRNANTQYLTKILSQEHEHLSGAWL